MLRQLDFEVHLQFGCLEHTLNHCCYRVQIALAIFAVAGILKMYFYWYDNP